MDFTKEKSILYSTVSQGAVVRQLYIGTFLALGGLTLLLWVFYFYPPQQLKKIGCIVFILSCALMAAGLLPVRRLYKLQLLPHKLCLDSEGITFYKGSSPFFVCVWSEIGAISYHNSNYSPGITITLKNQKSYFLSFFTQKSYDTLQHFYKINQPP